jgi:hypothetical protein
VASRHAFASQPGEAAMERGLHGRSAMTRRKQAPAHAPRTLGELIVAVHDQAARSTRGARNRRRLAAVWTTVMLLGSGNRGALRRLAAVR